MIMHLDPPVHCHDRIEQSRLKFYAKTSHARGPFDFEGKITSIFPKIGVSTPPQTLVRLQFIYPSKRRENVHVMAA